MANSRAAKMKRIAIGIKEVERLREKTALFSVAKCPPALPVGVSFFIADSVPRCFHDQLYRPVYFDKLCTVTVESKSSRPRPWPLKVKTAKDVARYAVRNFRGFQERFGPPVHFDRPVLDTRAISPRNIAHILINILPLCLYARDKCGADTAFVFDHLGVYDKLCRSILSRFGIEPFISHRKISGPIVHVRGTRGLNAYDLVDTFDCPVLSFLPDIFDGASFENAKGYEKIFIARRDARSIVNQEDVESVTTAHGYRTVYLEDYSIPEQMGIGASAQRVIAIHGAGMAFLSLNKGIESLIEISPPHVFQAFFPIAFGRKVKKYSMLICGFDERVMHIGRDTQLHFMSNPFSVDVSLLERAIKES